MLCGVGKNEIFGIFLQKNLEIQGFIIIFVIAFRSKEQGTKIQDKNGMTDVSEDGIMKRILAYPIEQHSPTEAMAFLSEIKQQLSERATIQLTVNS